MSASIQSNILFTLSLDLLSSQSCNNSNSKKNNKNSSSSNRKSSTVFFLSSEGKYNPLDRKSLVSGCSMDRISATVVVAGKTNLFFTSSKISEILLLKLFVSCCLRRHVRNAGGIKKIVAIAQSRDRYSPKIVKTANQV